MLFTDSSPLTGDRIPLVIGADDGETLRTLAGDIAELSSRPIEAEKRDRWLRHNALLPERPLVFRDPENAWHEIIPDRSLTCTGELARSWEFYLRKERFWGKQMCDDRVITAHFDVAHVYRCSGWGVDARRLGGQDGGAYTWDSPIQSAADIAELHAPEITVDPRATEQLLALAHRLFDGVLAVRLRTKWWWSLGLTWNLTAWRGLQQFMYDMIDQPATVHQLMSVLRDGAIAALDSLEARGLLAPNNDDAYVGSGGFGGTTELSAAQAETGLRCRDMWGFAESQETVGISPAMFEEFIFPYQHALLERFGLNCYGCCEPLDSRWHIVQRFPRLRRISVSPWANRAYMAEMLGDRYIYSMKPNPADLAMPEFDEEHVRAVLRDDLRAASGCHVEIIMKDTHTIRSDPSRATRWVQIALEEAKSLAG